jgi:molecular chaperone DnaK
MAIDNRTLGRFQLTGIPPAPRGIPQIEVAFDIDANGILHVSAKDLGTGKEQSIQIKSSSGLSDKDVERMRKEADEHAEDDRRKRETADSRNTADQLLYSTEKTLKDYGDKVGEAERNRIREAMERLKKVKGGDDLNAIKSAIDELTTASHSIAQAMYERVARDQQARQSEAGGRPAEEGEKKGKDDEVIDAEFDVKQ